MAGELYGDEIKSAMQDKRMDEFQERLDKFDVRVQKDETDTAGNTNAISGFHGETRGVFLILGLLQIGGYVFASRKGKTT